MIGAERIPRAAALLLLFGAFTSAALAQQYSFQYFGVEQGLTNLAVKKLFQDRTGFIWVGTENGIFRYEGVRFREFSPEQGLPLSVSASIGEAPDGSVLVGNQTGLYRLRGNRFEKVFLPAGTRVNGYNGIVRRERVTYVATDAGLLQLTIEENGRIIPRPGPRSPAEPQAEAHSVYASQTEVLWGCGLSLCRLEPGGGVSVRGQSSGLKAAVVQAILPDPQGNLWVEQNRQLEVLREGSARFEGADPKLPPTGPDSPKVDSEGRLLVPTTAGLAIRENNRFRLAGRMEGLLPPVYSVLQDREGAVWLGLAGRGLAKWLGYSTWENFSAQSGLTGETVYEILPQPDGTIWAGTEAGFFRGERGRDNLRWTQIDVIGAVPVHAVQNAGNGRLWLGTDSHGAALFDPRTGRAKWYGLNEGLAGVSPYSILVDAQNTVWAGTEKGTFVLQPGTAAFRRVDELPNWRCWALLQTKAGDIWAGTSDGLWRRERDGHWRQFTQADGLQSKSVISMAVDKAGSLWLGYRLTGTVTELRIANDRLVWTHHPADEGRAINITYFLGFDAHDRLWAGTNLGVQVRHDRRWDRYDHRDGLIWDDCDLHGFAAEPDGHIWIGTSGGLSRFLPQAAHVHPDPPRTVFTSVSLDGKELDPLSKMLLEYSPEPLVARFTALRFGHDRDISFRYRLSPVAKNWTETPARELQFPALNPGSFRLEVEARDALTGWSNLPAAIEFTVTPPWWREWWFVGGCMLAASLCAGLFLRVRSGRESAVRRELERAVEERTRELSHQYRHDVLTGLPNRLLFRERLDSVLEAARSSGSHVAVLFLDLDRFKRINDTWGHQTGDLFLKQIAERLHAGLHEGEMIARIGGDEFIVLIPRLDERAESSHRGAELLRTLDEPIELEDKNVFATMSIGIATFPDDAGTASALMAAADAAMYRAKADGKNQVQLYEARMTDEASRPQNIEDRLREALKNDGFRLVYQPQYTLDGRVDGFEALLRIVGSNMDLGPAEFIPIAEESGLIVEIGEWVLREACSQARQWHLNGHPDIRIAVNVSVMQLAHPGFERHLAAILQETSLEPRRLELELTETAMLKNTGDCAERMSRIRRLGISLALDDFGTGFSPMQYLHQLPVDVVKIDRLFTSELDGAPSCAPLVEGMVKLARTLSLKVVAEGCETEEQLRVIRKIGFDGVQGNLLSAPVSASLAQEILRESLVPVGGPRRRQIS